MKHSKKILTVLLAGTLALALFGACGKENGDDAANTPAIEGGNTVTTPWKSGDPYPVVTMTIGDNGAFEGGDITIELYPDVAPNTVHNFISLINDGFYVDKVFHRAVPNFMIQGGSVNGDGMSGGFPYTIKCETSGQGFVQNDLRHTDGVISMAHAGPNTGGSQFFIMTGSAPHLDGLHTAFGMVTEGMDVVERIELLPTSSQALITKPKIAAITVDTFGIEYPAPVKN